MAMAQHKDTQAAQFACAWAGQGGWHESMRLAISQLGLAFRPGFLPRSHVVSLVGLDFGMGFWRQGEALGDGEIVWRRWVMGYPK